VIANWIKGVRREKPGDPIEGRWDDGCRHDGDVIAKDVSLSNPVRRGDRLPSMRDLLVSVMG
jgi:hypothetical protein